MNSKHRALSFVAMIVIAAAIVFFFSSRRAAEDEDANKNVAALAPRERGTTPPARDTAHSEQQTRGVAPSTEPADEAEVSMHSIIDFAGLRKKIPNNLYWRVGAPSKNPVVQKAREEESASLNTRYGKILAGEASEEEIKKYYGYREQVSKDMRDFGQLVLDQYGDKLPESERGMYELSVKLHSGLLAEIPGHIEEALAKKRSQDQLREEWIRKGRP